MKKMLPLLLKLFGFYFIVKSLSLFLTKQDGEGVGIYLFNLVVINKKVLNEHIMLYVIGFMLVGITLLMISSKLRVSE